MATFVVCTRCGTTHEVDAPGLLPKGWRREGPQFLCLRCADTAADEVISDVLEEELIYPQGPADDTLDEDVDKGCEVCGGPCQGH